MRAQLKPFTIALGSIFGLVSMAVLFYFAISFWGVLQMGNRPAKDVDLSVAMSECAQSLGDFCSPLAPHYLNGTYKENFLVGGVTTLNFAVRGEEREKLIKEFYLLPGYDYERKGNKNDGLNIFAYRVGEDKLQLVFSLD